MYVAGTNLKVGRADGVVETRLPGDAVPEAATWKWHTVAQYVKNGLLKEIPDPTPEQKQASRSARAREA